MKCIDKLTATYHNPQAPPKTPYTTTTRHCDTYHKRQSLDTDVSEKPAASLFTVIKIFGGTKAHGATP